MAILPLAPRWGHHVCGVFRRRKSSDDTAILLDLALMLMQLDAKLNRVLQLLGEDDAEEEMDT